MGDILIFPGNQIFQRLPKSRIFTSRCSRSASLTGRTECTEHHHKSPANKDPKYMLSLVGHFLMWDALGKDHPSWTYPSRSARFLVTSSEALMLFTSLDLAPDHHRVSGTVCPQGLLDRGVGQLAHHSFRTRSSRDLFSISASLGHSQEVLLGVDGISTPGCPHRSWNSEHQRPIDELSSQQ